MVFLSRSIPPSTSEGKPETIPGGSDSFAIPLRGRRGPSQSPTCEVFPRRLIVGDARRGTSSWEAQAATLPSSVSTSSSVGLSVEARAVQSRAIRAQVGQRIWSTSVWPDSKKASSLPNA